jgi:hypothetical protein
MLSSAPYKFHKETSLCKQTNTQGNNKNNEGKHWIIFYTNRLSELLYSSLFISVLAFILDYRIYIYINISGLMLTMREQSKLDVSPMVYWDNL